MKLSLSIRIAEEFAAKDKALMPFEELARLASDIGYDALCMRASQAGIETPPERRLEMRSLLDDLGLGVTMVTGDISIAANDSNASAALRNIDPYLDLADDFGSPLARVMITDESDIEHARRAALRAAARGIRLAHQTHVGTLLETVDEAVGVAERVGAAGFGITVEPANLLAAGDACGPAEIDLLAPYLVNVYLQNQKIDDDGDTVIKLRDSSVHMRNLPLDAGEGINLESLFKGLEKVGYDGPVTVHQSAIGGLPIEASARRYYELLAPFIA